jgi:ribosomal protein L32
MKVKKRKRTQRRAHMENVSAMLCYCRECGEKGARHFVPPCFGDIGFFSCNPPADIRNHTRCEWPWDHEHPLHFDIRFLRREDINA